MSDPSALEDPPTAPTLVRLREHDLAVGVPLESDVVDTTGKLLLRRGQQIGSEAIATRLISRGVSRPSTPADGSVHFPRGGMPKYLGQAVTVRKVLADARRTLGVLFTERPADGSFGPCVLEVAAAVQRACHLDPDAALAAILVDRDADYPIRQAVNCAIVSELLLGSVCPDTLTRRRIVAGALTMNLGMAALQALLYAQSGPLTDSQRAAIRAHPEAGARDLARLGVTDTLWLGVILRHHEAPDGSGYPMGLSGEAIPLGAQGVGLADRYCAMVSERAYRVGLQPNSVLRELFLERGKAFDARICALAVKELGIYPPGSLVSLKNGEAGIVVRRTLQANQPLVRGLVSNLGIAFEHPPTRITSDATFTVQGAIARDTLRAPVEPDQLWPHTFVFDEPVLDAEYATG